MILLSVDWDYFFPVPSEDPRGLYDWGHQESPLFMGPELWKIREANFHRVGLLRPHVNDEWVDFWNYFPISPDATLFYGESHAWAANVAVAEGVDEVWSYDAHHDLGYIYEKILSAFEGQYECDSWLLHYVRQRLPVHIRYPSWRDHEDDGGPASVLRFVSDISASDPGEITAPIDRVFVCRSGAWVPPWCDQDYSDFIDLCPAGERVDLGPSLGWPSTPRDYNQADVDSLIQWMKTTTG